MKTIVGLTGGYCSGKNQVARILAAHGYYCIDVDALGHRALELSKNELAETFGAGILDAHGGIDRKALGALVFASKSLLEKHESIVHPVMLSLLDEELEKSERVCINAALLYKFPQAAKCSFIIEVTAPLEIRLERARIRDGVNTETALARIANQEYLWKLRPAVHPPVFFISNEGFIKDLEASLARIPGLLPRDT